MGGWQRGFNRDVGDDTGDAGVVGKQQRLAVGGAMNLDLAMRLALETLDDDEIDPRQLCQQFRNRGSSAPRSSCIRAQRWVEDTSTSVAPDWRCSQESLPEYRRRRRDGRA